jgi:competence protein ComEA
VVGDAGERDAVRARLARVAAPPGGSSSGSPPPSAGWVPAPPGDPPAGDVVPAADEDAPSDDDDPATDGDAIAARRALAAALAAYTAAHGHPLEGADAAAPARYRLATPARAAVAGLLGLLLVAGVVVLRVAPRTPSVTLPLGPAASAPAPGADEGAAVGATAAPDAGGPEGEVVVHVVGAVAAPGVVRLPPGSRVADAVAAAGGATAEADLAGVNLARVVADGEQVVVPRPGEAAAAAVTAAGGGTTGGTGGAGGAAGPLDLNAADAAALDTLPGIGPVLAERIVAWRAEHGRFTSVEELTEVSGIGPTLLARLRDLVRVG